MRNMFEDNRLAHILILMRKSSVMDVDTLANQLSVSSRTIRNDIKELNALLDDSSTIEMDQGRCSLRIFNVEGFLDTFTSILETDDLNSSRTRMNYVFGSLLRSEEPILTDDLAYEMSIGRSTLVKDIKKLRDELKKYDVQIVGKTSKGLVLEGLEKDIRKYIIENNFYEMYKEYPLDDEIQDVIDDFMDQSGYEPKVQKNLNMYLTLMLDRYLNGHFIGHLSDTFYNISSHPQFPLLDRLIDEISGIIHVDFPIEEKLFVLLPIVGMRTPDATENMTKIDLDQNAKELYEKISQAIKERLDITMEPSDSTDEFLYHLMFMSNRLRYGIHTENALVDAIAQKYPLAYEMGLIACEVIENELGVEVSKSEIGFITSYFIVYLEQHGKQNIDNIAIVCGTGKSAARLVYAQLKNIIDSNTAVDLYSDNTVNEDLLNRYDVVLSTVELSYRLQIPILYISEIFDENELRNRIDKVRYLGKENTMVDDNWFVISNRLEEDKFFYLKDCDSYESGLTCMLDSLYDNGYLDSGFKQRLFEREKMATMVLGNRVAIPHMINDCTDDFVFSLGVLPNPVMYHDLEVQLIFLLALPKNLGAKDDLLIRMYDEIITIMKDQELVDRLVKVTRHSQALRTLYKRK